jgi:hypothetical protein
MAVNEKISGDLTISGSIIGGGVVPNITSTNYLPVLRANPNPQMESSGFYYLDSTSTGRLYHDALIPQSGNIESNFILDTDAQSIKIGATPYGWPYPVVGFSANLNGFGINGGSSPYGPPIEYANGVLFFRESYGSSSIEINQAAINLSNYSGGQINLFGQGGIYLNAPGASVVLGGTDLNINAENIFLAGNSLFDSGTYTPSGNYLKVFDAINGIYYYLPLYT